MRVAPSPDAFRTSVDLAHIKGMSMDENLMPFQVRLVEELTELEAKLNKLDAMRSSSFFDELDIPTKSLLDQQSIVMLRYIDIMKKRLELMQIDTRIRIGENKRLCSVASDLRNILDSYVALYDEHDPVAKDAIGRYDYICKTRGLDMPGIV